MATDVISTLVPLSVGKAGIRELACKSPENAGGTDGTITATETSLQLGERDQRSYMSAVH